VLLADRLRSPRVRLRHQGGISIAIKDMVIPAKKQEMLDGAQKEVADDREPVPGGPDHRRRTLQQVIDIWAQVTGAGGRRDDERDRHRVVKKDGKEKKQPSFNPIFHHGRLGRPGFRRSRCPASWRVCAD